MIIGFAGPAGVGKDTAAKYLVEYYGFERRAFADALKQSVANLFDIPIELVDELKGNRTATVYLNFGRGTQMNVDLGTARTFRSFLQRYGTEAHRDVFGGEFWIKPVLPSMSPAFYIGQKIVISDVRFEEEARAINTCGGYVVQLYGRGGLETAHRSEAGVPDRFVHYHIDNSSQVEALYDKLDNMLETFSART